MLTDAGRRCNYTVFPIFIKENIMAKSKEKDPCWSGYHKEGTKKKNGKTVNNCVKDEKKSSK